MNKQITKIKKIVPRKLVAPSALFPIIHAFCVMAAPANQMRGQQTLRRIKCVFYSPKRPIVKLG